MLALGCVFCDLIEKKEFLTESDEAVVLIPLNPVVEDGHLLVIPKEHIPDFTWNPTIAGNTMMLASYVAQKLGGEWNLITSAGPAATQTVFHLHLHLVRRTEGDGLHLPWTNQKK